MLSCWQLAQGVSGTGGTVMERAKADAMQGAARQKNRRILVVDDVASIHADFRALLGPGKDTSELDDFEASIFGASSAGAGCPTPMTRPDYKLAFARQGKEALSMVQQALREDAPFALAFVDMRMPPGWDGLKTLEHLWAEDPLLQAVICSAYADQSWDEIAARFGSTDRLLILKKPFDPVEVRQLACAMTEKWNQRAEAAAGEEALRQSEARNRALLDAIPDTILRIGDDGVVLDAKLSQENAPIPGDRTIVGRSVHEALGQEIATRIREQVEQAIRGDAAVSFEYAEGSGEGAIHREVQVVGAGQVDAVVIIRNITERKRAEQEAAELRAQKEAIRAQTEVLTAMSAPLIPITDGIVVMPLIGELDPPRIRQVQEALVEGIAARRARVAILDVTGLTNLGPDAAQGIVRVAQAARLLGASVILTGIQPNAAVSLVNSGCDLQGVVTRQSLQEGIAYALRAARDSFARADLGSRDAAWGKIK